MAFDPLRFCLRPVDEATRVQRIRQRAYFLAERRRFIPGEAVADWIAAEAEVNREISLHALDRVSKT